MSVLGCSSAEDAIECPGRAAQGLFGGTSEESYLSLGIEHTLAIVRLHDRSGRSSSTCTGALIRPNWVLSAAHCLQIEALGIEFALPAAAPRAVDVVESVPHSEVDVALLRLDARGLELELTPFSIEWARVDDRWIGERAELAGFGIGEDGIPAGLTFAVETITEVSETTLTVNGLGRSGACRGDSGGPLLVRNQLGQPAVLGVLSKGSASCLHRDTYVRVDGIADWIESVVGAAAPQTSPCGAIDGAGRCSFGQVLVCHNGALEVIACDTETICGWDGAREQFACVEAEDDPCLGAGSAGLCEGTLARSCSSGVVSEVDCGPCGGCGYSSTTGLPQCVPG